MKLSLCKSVLLCESKIKIDADAQNETVIGGKITVSDDSVLTPNCLYSGKWAINGEHVSYYENIMQDNTNIHVFSINSKDEQVTLTKQMS